MVDPSFNFSNRIFDLNWSVMGYPHEEDAFIVQKEPEVTTSVIPFAKEVCICVHLCVEFMRKILFYSSSTKMNE